MELYQSYKGPDTLLKFLCPPTTPMCNSICEKRSEPIQPKSKLPKEPEQCIHVVNENEVRECLITRTMRCWRGGASVFDGSHEWTLIFHEEISESHPEKVPWIHLTSNDRRADAFVFGWNQNDSGENPCEKFLESSKLLNKLEVARNDFEIMLGGHGSGALWAHCANLRLAESGRPPQFRKVVNTGIPMVTNEFLNHYLVTAEPETTILNLLVASNIQEIGHLVDLKPILKAPAGFHTFLTFGYSCSSNFEMRLQSLTCMDPQPEVNIDNSLRHALLLPISLRTPLLQTLHSFSMYQSCFRACRQQFQRDAVDFIGINVMEYEKHEADAVLIIASTPEVMEVEDSDEASADEGSSQQVFRNFPPSAPPGLTELIRNAPSTSTGSMSFYDRSRDPRLQQREHGDVQSRLEGVNLSASSSPQPERAQSPATASDEDYKPQPIAPHLRNAMD